MEKILKKMGITVLFTLLLLPAAVRAQQKGSIELKSTAEIDVTETNAKGMKETRQVEVSKAKVLPGDVVTFTTTYTNRGNKPAEQVIITNPVPEHMDYLAGSAEGKGMKIDFSVDKGKTYNSPENLVVIDPQGKTRTAVPADYTHIRWSLEKPLPAGGTGSVSFRAKLR